MSPTTFPAAISGSPASALCAMPRIVPARKSPKISRRAWLRSSSPAPEVSGLPAAPDGASHTFCRDLCPSPKAATSRLRFRRSENDRYCAAMVALRGKEIDSFLARPDPGRPIVLLYGPDAGLVRERAEALLASAVDDPTDPFSLVRLDGDELSAEPSRLVDEALTIPLFGGRRAIRIRAGSRSFASGVDTLAEQPLKDCRIVIEAGELRPESPLRKACERAKTAVAIGCYPDGERDLARLIDDELRPANLRIAADARASLTALLGGDRQASRNELRKLTLYAHGKGEVTLDDVMAVVADASELKIDPIVDGAFAGKP